MQIKIHHRGKDDALAETIISVPEDGFCAVWFFEDDGKFMFGQSGTPAAQREYAASQTRHAADFRIIHEHPDLSDEFKSHFFKTAFHASKL